MNLSDLEEIFKNKKLFRKALVHRSFLNESREFKESNERLEFLGDSVLQLLTSQYLYERFPAYTEGQMTNLRSMIVRTGSLAQMAKNLSIGPHLQMSRGEKDSGGQANDSLLADAMEAIIGALFLDSGLEAVRTFLNETLFPGIDQILKENKVYDYKSLAQELTQRELKKSPHYEVLNSSGPDHDRTFTVGFFLGLKKISEGVGKSKQFAEQEAAKSALEKLTKE